MKFSKKIVLVTGSSRGLGAKLIYDFAKEGAKVVINYNNSEKEAFALRDRIKKEFFSEVLCIKCDVSNEKEVSLMVDDVISSFGKIDVLINNAGICSDSEFDRKTADDFMNILKVNLIGTYLVTKHVAKFIKNGKIINISSDNALNSYYPESAEYDASKAGIVSLTHNMAKFYAPNINVNCVCPGWINTDMNKNLDGSQINTINKEILLGRIADVSDISNIVLFLASDEASYINDEIIRINGGENNGFRN